MMPVFEIRYGLGGGFGGCAIKDWERIEAKDEASAADIAYEMACEEYETYDGMYGLRDVQMICEEDGVDEDEAHDIWAEERESWLDYEVREVKE